MIGHGLGFTGHEMPFICRGDYTPWREGMCGALEVLYGDEQYGFIEWENDFLVIEDGVKILTPFDASLWIVDAS